MKDVMCGEAMPRIRQGALQFAQASRTNFILLFDDRGDAMKRDIQKALAKGPQKVELFCHDWVIDRDNLLCEPAYKQALLEMERMGRSRC
jgi:hypothetical protein